MDLIESGLKHFDLISPANKHKLGYIAWGYENEVFRKDVFVDELVKSGFNHKFADMYADTGFFVELRSNSVFSMAKVKQESSIPHALIRACPMGDYWVCDVSGKQQKNASKWASVYHIGGVEEKDGFLIFFLFGHPFSAGKSKRESASWTFKGFVLQVGGSHYFWEASQGTDLKALMWDLGCGSKGNHNDNPNSIIKKYGLKRTTIGNPLNYFQ